MTDEYVGRDFDTVGGGTVYRLPEQTRLDAGRSLEVRNHSPDGFQIGYGGSGPSQLALALLLDVTDDEEVACRHYQDFKNEVTSNLEPGWSLSVEVIENFIEERE